MAENIISNTVKNHGDAVEVANWISQINAGGTTYDIATHHGITFKDGKGDTGTTWNGLTDLEIVIPNISDIVQTPIEFAGTVGADGEITWVNGHSKEEAGSLVFITENCTFDGKPCEKGDMAIYDGAKWYTISGEHQIEILGTADNNKVTVAVGAAADVLTVEGKTLALTLDYAELDKHVSLTRGGDVKADLSKLTVDSTYVTLTKGNDVSTTIGKEETIQKATNLADGTVTLTNADQLVKDVTFGTFSAGEFPTLTFNTSDKKLDIAGGSVSVTTGEDFVKTVTMASDKKAIITADTTNEAEIVAVTGISVVEGQSFVNDIHVTKEGETANFVIPGHLKTEVSDVKFVSGLNGDVQTVVTGLSTAGDVKLADGTVSVATSFGSEAATGDVVSSVNLSYDNNTSVLKKATVTDHVLSFDTENVTSAVSATYGYKSLNTQNLVYTAPTLTSASFVTSGFIKGDDMNYTFTTAKETTYTTTEGKWKFNSEAINVTKGAYQINHDNMKATIPANTYAVNTTAGVLPSLTEGSYTPVSVTGSVATALSYTDVKFNALTSNTIDLPGTYTLTTTSASGDGVVTVGKAGAMKEGSEVSVNLSAYVTDVEIITTASAQ